MLVFFKEKSRKSLMKSRGLVREGDGLSCFTRNGGQIIFLSEAERNEEYRVCYFMSFPMMSECFVFRASLLLSSGRDFF